MEAADALFHASKDIASAGLVSQGHRGPCVCHAHAQRLAAWLRGVVVVSGARSLRFNARGRCGPGAPGPWRVWPEARRRCRATCTESLALGGFLLSPGNHSLPGRLELPTLRLTASGSSQLSYGSICTMLNLYYTCLTLKALFAHFAFSVEE